MDGERAKVLRGDPSRLMWEARQPKRNGWSVRHRSVSGDSSSVSRPHRTLVGAVVSLLWDFEPGQPRRRVVNHDAEMRRWGYLMGIIEPTDQERATLPKWHANYRGEGQ